MPSGIILQPTYRVRDGVPVVQLFGRLEAGPAFLVEDDRFRPYFFAPLAGLDAARLGPGVAVAETPLRALGGDPVARIEVPTPAAVPPLRDRLPRAFEADVRFAYRYLIDRGIRAGVRIEGPSRSDASGLLRFPNPELHPAECRPALRLLSLDLETTPDAGRILSAALVGDGADEVHLVYRERVEGAHIHADERALLAAVARRVREIDPDILTGWNVVDFDLRTWAARGQAQRVAAHLGRVEGELTFQDELRFARQNRATLPGRMVLDAMALVRDAVRLSDYRLETAAQTLLGRGKLIDAEAVDPAQEIQRLYRDEPAALAAYNREDARLVLDILAREGLVDLAVERSLLTGMQLDRVGASVASFDLLYLPALRARGYVAPSVDSARENAEVHGGAVLDSTPGVFSNVAVFDFRSLYPSLVRTFNLDPLAHALAGDDAFVAPNGARFSRSEAILPGIIERFLANRERAKQRGDHHADRAIKIMMNALFGVLGTASCRFFDPEIANAITGFGQQTLRWTRDAFEGEGAPVLYGDTDSVFVQLREGAPEAAREQADGLRARVERHIAQRVREEYGAEPRLVLELERVFERFFMPRVRGGRSGSKKRYAGLCDGRLELVGLEAVRRDWPALAGRLQRGLLLRLFRGEPGLPFVREVIERMREGELDAELVYAKRVRKGSLDRYTATTPPHIQAARKAGGRAGPVVRYVITEAGPEPILPGRPLPAPIDRSHYIERVLRPVAEAILSHVDEHFDDALGRPRQLTLL
ncbi:MAG TPA: DNA polymerase II [Myxococcota bacterium]